jgi:hypothetical protein
MPGRTVNDTIDEFIPLTSTPQYLDALNRARSGWNPSPGALANFHDLVDTGFVGGGRSQFRMVRDPNPAAIALRLLDYRLRNEGTMTEQQRARRFVMVVKGRDAEGVEKRMARAIDPTNVHQMLALTTSIAGGQANRATPAGAPKMNNWMMGGSSEDGIVESDPTAYKFTFMHEVESVTLRALNPEEMIDDNGDIVTPPPPAASAASVPISSSSSVPPAVRRSSRIEAARRARIGAPGSTSGAFFRYWLAESFPESLSFLQVYKKSESKQLVKNLSVKGSWAGDESFELSCLANSIILQGLPTSKYITLFEYTCANGNPSFPSSRMGELAKALRITIVFSTYSPDRMTSGRRQKTYPHAEEGDEEVYFVGRVGSHYVPDFLSDWTRYAIRHYSKLKELGGRAYCDLPLFRIKQLKGVHVSESAPFIQFETRGSGQFATYGEVLSVLLWGYSDPGEEADEESDSSSRQYPFVEAMSVEDICLRAELYMYFQSMLQFIDLPTHSMKEDELDRFVEQNNREIGKHCPSILSFQPGSANPLTWGASAPRKGGHTEIALFREQYEKEGGAKPTKEWLFPDRHVLKTCYTTRGEGDASSPPTLTPFSVLLPYTMVAFDTETMSVPVNLAAQVVNSFHRMYSNPADNDYVGGGEPATPSVISLSMVESVLGEEGICSWEEDGMRLEEEEREPVRGKDGKVKTVHIPYCVSVCYYVYTDTLLPINFRSYSVDAFGVHPSPLLAATRPFRLEKKTFYGFDCMIQLNVFLGSGLFDDVSVHLIAHNARYDVNMMMKYSFAIISDGIFRSTGKMNVCDLSIQAFPSQTPDELLDTAYGGKMKGRVFRRSNAWEHKRQIRVQCSLACTGIPLSAFASTFDMNIAKEYMPYSVYTLYALFETEDVNGGSIIKGHYGSSIAIDDTWHLTSAPSKEAFEDSVRSAGALECHGGKTCMNLWSYARYYCEMDCEVLLVGFLSLRREMYHLKILSPSQSSSSVPMIDEDTSPGSELMLENAVSLPQFASHYFGLNGVFGGVHEYKGLLMNFIRRGVTGGKTMLAGNSPVIYDFQEETEGTVEDLDAVNLYGSAMYKIAKELGGFPRGAPKIWAPRGGADAFSTFLPSFVRDSHYYFVLIRIKRLGRPLRFPIVSGPREIFPSAPTREYCQDPPDMGDEGIGEKGSSFDSAEELFERILRSVKSSGRHFTNHPEGARMVVDKVTFEDIMEFHRGMEFEVYQALYWDQGGNANIGAVMEYLFADRVKKQQQGKKAAAQARKLTMNAGYGRFLMAAPTSDYYFVEGKDNIHRYIARHSCTTKETSFIRDDFAVVERAKGAQQFYNASPLGAMVLSVSKRIMNRVMVMYEDLFERGVLGSKFGMFYQDTDSIHIVSKHIDPLFRAYTEKYQKKILVRTGWDDEDGEEERENFTIAAKALGAFCTDFEPVPGHTPPVSEVFIGVMKKVYVDCMSCNALVGGRERKEVFHARMKGIPKKCVEMEVEEDGELENICHLYEKIFVGDPVTFDLAKHSVRFDMGKDFSVSTNTSFNRVVRLNWMSILMAHIEWVKSGWTPESFPYVESFRKSIINRKEWQNVKWPYEKLMKSIWWDRVRENGRKNFFPVDVPVGGDLPSHRYRRTYIPPATYFPAYVLPCQQPQHVPFSTFPTPPSPSPASSSSSSSSSNEETLSASHDGSAYDIDSYRDNPLSSSGLSFEDMWDKFDDGNGDVDQLAVSQSDGDVGESFCPLSPVNFDFFSDDGDSVLFDGEDHLSFDLRLDSPPSPGL